MMEYPVQNSISARTVYGPRGQSRPEHCQAVNAVVISRPTVAPQCNHQPRVERPQRQYTRLNMPLSQILPQLLKTKLITLREAPKNPDTTSPQYKPNARCAYHSNSPGHDTNNCWALKNKVQDLIEAKEIEFDALKIAQKPQKMIFLLNYN